MLLIKVSLPEYDVKTATPEQCSVHSGFNSPKIDATKDNFISFSIFFQSEPPSTVGASLETILYKQPHGYTYSPELWVHSEYKVTYSGGRTRFGPGEALLAVATAADGAYVGARVDATYLYVYIRKEVGALGSDPLVVGKSVNLRVYVFADNL